MLVGLSLEISQNHEQSNNDKKYHKIDSYSIQGVIRVSYIPDQEEKIFQVILNIFHLTTNHQNMFLGRVELVPL